MHPVSKPWEHRAAACNHNVGVEVLPDVDVAPHDCVVDKIMRARAFHAEKCWLEERLWRSEPFSRHGDQLAVGELVRRVERRRRGGGLHLGFKVQGDVRKLFLHVPHNVAFGGGGEGVATFGGDLHHVVGQVPATNRRLLHRVGEGVALVDRDGDHFGVVDLEHDPSRPAGRVEREHGRAFHEHCRHVKRLEQNLRHLLFGCFRQQRRDCHQDRVLFRRRAELVVKRMVQQLLPFVKVGDDAFLHRVSQRQHASFGLGFVADVRVLLAHADHHALVARASNNRREGGAGRIVAGKPSFGHPASECDDVSRRAHVSRSRGQQAAASRGR